VKIRKFSDDGKDLGLVEMDKVVKSDAEWQKQLANAPGTLDEQGTTAFMVTRQEGTEYAGTGPYSESFDAGLYRCICCDNALYSSDTKFDSGTGWPSFYKPIAPENVVQNVPAQGGYKVSCALCDAHLGHVFDDRPAEPTGLRYCMDGVALRFIPAPAAKPA
jgi:peptide-methionine (R)-S-oxide reductase